LTTSQKKEVKKLEDLLKEANDEIKGTDHSLYGKKLHIHRGKTWIYIRGEPKPPVDEGYTFYKIDLQGNVYSHAGKKPLFQIRL